MIKITLAVLGLCFSLAVPAFGDGQCVKPEGWLHDVGAVAVSHQLEPKVVAERHGDEGKRLMSLMNAAPPVSDIKGDQFIVVAFLKDGSPLHTVEIAFFDNGCFSSQIQMPADGAVPLVTGVWPKPGEPA